MQPWYLPSRCRSKGANRVNRGGSWNDDAQNCRAAYRNANHPANRNDDLGFRLARALVGTGRSLGDPTGIATSGNVGGEHPRTPGVAVGRAEPSATPRRGPAP